MNPHGWRIKFILNHYKMEHSMVRGEYWDKDEYNFFMDLEDEDKLLYIYDLMIGDFKDDYYGESDVEFEFEEDDEQLRHDVFAVIDKSGFMSITADSESLITQVTRNMMMNGMMLTDKSITTLKDGTCVAQFKLLGNVSPISLN
jgi:hypothetical protein